MKYLFEWISDDSCELCDAMDEFYDDEPDRPHPYCDCHIDIVSEDWDWDFFILNIDSSGDMLHFEFLITVTCHLPNGDVDKEDHMEFDLPNYGEPGLEKAAEEKLDEIEDRAEDLAASCYLVS